MRVYVQNKQYFIIMDIHGGLLFLTSGTKAMLD